MLWAAAGALTLAFLVALEIQARHYGEVGPVTAQARELIFAPRSGPLLYAGLALTMVVLTWRQRLVALGVALGIDVLVLLVRWAAGAELSFGNGALWVVVGCAVFAVARRTGEERVLLLKGAGLGLLLLIGHKAGDTWLLITWMTRPEVLDAYVATADHALGNPSWLVGRAVEATSPVSWHVLHLIYSQLPLGAALIGLYQLRNVAAERRFPAHHLVRTFLAIGLVGPVFYMLFPVVGPVFAYGAEGGQWALANVWPDTVPPISTRAVPFDQLTPRNCMPSLHTAWAVTLFVHSRKGSRPMRWLGAFWLAATLTATLGFGYHYGADLVAGVVFALTIEASMRAVARGWDRSATLLVCYGTAVFTALLLAYRYLPGRMAALPWAFGPLMLLAMASVIYFYVRTTRLWELTTAPAKEVGLPRRAEPQPEPA
ncbi:phosphatase PAP2 family protein [Streptomyces sp. NPDC050085]|uniref:phosphatase PAP2 family protein n=1 Tax=Streptomyces sp. NPDC050085 TaxID=3365600 RepID=UPI0037BC32F7